MCFFWIVCFVCVFLLLLLRILCIAPERRESVARPLIIYGWSVDVYKKKKEKNMPLNIYLSHSQFSINRRHSTRHYPNCDWVWATAKQNNLISVIFPNEQINVVLFIWTAFFFIEFEYDWRILFGNLCNILRYFFFIKSTRSTNTVCMDLTNTDNSLKY